MGTEVGLKRDVERRDPADSEGREEESHQVKGELQLTLDFSDYTVPDASRKENSSFMRASLRI